MRFVPCDPCRRGSLSRKGSRLLFTRYAAGLLAILAFHVISFLMWTWLMRLITLARGLSLML